MFRFGIIVVVVIAIAGYGLYLYHGGFGAPEEHGIEEILGAPDKFENQPITVRGVVKSPFGILNVGVFNLRDKDGDKEIVMITASGVPTAGAEITRKGVFRKAITFGKYQLPVIFVTP